VSELSVAEKVYNALIESISGKDTSTKIITIKAMLPALAGYKGEYPQLSNTLDEITSLLRNEVKRLNLE
jgi:rhamnogalacturonyl hydrolase YesR